MFGNKFVQAIKSGKYVCCPQCRGAGTMIVDEGPRRIQDACYHCSTDGYITVAQWKQDRMQMLVDRMAGIAVEHRINAVNSNPEGEGWGFAAAENGMSERDFTEECHMAESDRIMRWLSAVEPDICNTLIDTVLPLPRPRHRPGMIVRATLPPADLQAERELVVFDTCARAWLVKSENDKYEFVPEDNMEPVKSPERLVDYHEDDVPF